MFRASSIAQAFGGKIIHAKKLYMVKPPTLNTRIKAFSKN